jgi:flagellar motor switch protein FliN/FliY
MAVGRSGEPLDQADIDAVLAAAQAAAAMAPEGDGDENDGVPGAAEVAVGGGGAPVAAAAAPVSAPAAPIFAPMDEPDPPSAADVRNLDIVMDVPLEVSVELGRKRMSIRQILDLGSGSIVELDKIAGEPVDLLVNGRLVARGEVVVIEDNFGVRITEIVGGRSQAPPNKNDE